MRSATLRTDAEAVVMAHTEPAVVPLVPELRLQLLRPDSSLWVAFDAGSDPRRLPRAYWGFAWASGQALARHVLDHPDLVRGRDVLDLGTGCGIAALAAARAGARRVTANDTDPLAGAATQINAEANDLVVEVQVGDVIYGENPGWEVVLVGDLWYETRLARHGLRWLRSLAAQGVRVLAADPGRAYSPSRGVKPVAVYRVRSVPEIDAPELQEVAIYEIAPEG